MTALYYDMDDAFHAGATQAEVLAVLQSHGLTITKTRFGQNLFKLRGIFPPRDRGAKIDPAQLEKLATDMQSLVARTAPKAQAHAVTAERQSALPVPQMRVRPRATPQAAPLAERVRVCALAIEQLAQPKADAVAISADLRGALGAGWSIKTAVQFVGGTRFADWAQAQQADPSEAGRLMRLHQLAAKIIFDGMPDAAKLPVLVAKLGAGSRARNSRNA